MHKLTRQVRFSINPFLPNDKAGFNSYASKPCGEGLSIFFEFGISLIGEIEPSSGFVVNVTEIDKKVREHVVPIFADEIKKSYMLARHIDMPELFGLMQAAYKVLKGKFGKSIKADMSLKLNPYRKIAFDCEDWKMIYFSEKFEFAAMHKLWNKKFTKQQNYEVFGKCANPNGHGHNYVVEVTVKMPVNSMFSVAEFQQVVDEEFVSLVDHKNLNTDVKEFSKKNPTIENISVFAWSILEGRFGAGKLHSVTVWETDKTCCTYYG